MSSQHGGLWFLILAFLYVNPLLAEGGDHAEESAQAKHSDAQGLEEAHEDGHGHQEENSVYLNRAQRRSAGIIVERLAPRPIPTEIEAPGEIHLNAYASSQVSSRIEAQVVKRHARLGNSVVVGQPLVTLSSVSMAEAQGTLLVAAKDWQRVKKLGKKVVSERRYLETQVASQQARARLLAYGMTRKQTARLINANNIAQADGRFTLLSPQAGTVIRDDFLIGQMVGPGELLFELTDESRLWVEARVNPKWMPYLGIGAAARVLAGERWIDGKVVQIHHALDEFTRTLAVRLEIPNPDDRLHPGQFVRARIQTGESGTTALSLPLDAVLRSPDGDWQVFVEQEAGVFEPKEVDVIRQLPGLAVIEGLAPGTRVVTRGAFFVRSERAKSGFDVHNH